ncbi:hypothetical protein F5X99DRAFT_422225 [Biscogniauxia marginata]|nr:hypothetical protein F5X99DRAFT_422225 [Biscogniauxia marginata]
MSKPDDDSPPVDTDTDILAGPPSTTYTDFKHARLRQFPGHAGDIKWLEYLGHGKEGIVFKASIGSGDPIAIKTRPEPHRLPGGSVIHRDWPFEDESRTVALLEKIGWAMSQAESDPGQSVNIKYGPRTGQDAMRNLKAFSDEERCSSRGPDDPNLTEPPPFPPFPRCYGWMKIEKNQLPLLDPPVREAEDDSSWYWAIIYELIPSTGQDITVGQGFLDFCYAVGFALEFFKPDNWRGGRLVDLNDICSPLSQGWRIKSVRYREAAKWFWTLDLVQAPKRKICRVVRT